MMTLAGNAIYLAGLPENSLKNIRLENVNAVGKYGMKACNVDGLVMENVKVTALEDTNDCILKNVRIGQR